jgi:hypothetical protein
LRRTRRAFSEKGDDKVIDFHSEEAAQLIEPQRSVNSLWGLCKLYRNLTIDWDHRVRSFGLREVVVKGFEVFLELKRRIKLIWSANYAKNPELFKCNLPAKGESAADQKPYRQL